MSYLSLVAFAALLGVIGCYRILCLFAFITFMTWMFPTALVLLVIAVVLVAATGHLGFQAWRANGPARQDPTNPYVYGHTTGQAITLANQIHEIARAGEDGMNTFVQIISSDGGSFVIPGGPCAGSQVDLSPPFTLITRTADFAGNVNLSGTVPAQLCGRLMQIVDMTSCNVGGVVIIQ